MWLDTFELEHKKQKKDTIIYSRNAAEGQYYRSPEPKEFSILNLKLLQLIALFLYFFC